MINVKLKDGSVRGIEENSTILDLAKSISKKLGKSAVVGEVNGTLVDLAYKLQNNDEVNIVTYDDEAGIEVMRHTTSHVMAQAVKRLYKDVKLAIGPTIENGFYYDFDIETPFNNEDLVKIEEEMNKIIKEDILLERMVVSREEALKLMEGRGEPYKVELIKDLPEGETISLYKQGNFIDLCRGPHLLSTKGIKDFKLTSVAGAYWRGNEKNKMLQRVYGVAFANKDILKSYLNNIEEAKKRDHRRLGKELKLFTFVDEGPGFPFFLPKGVILKNNLINYWRELHQKAGYVEVETPIMLNKKLWETSGHWDHYKENMFPSMKVDDEEFVLRPMNCPHHMLIYGNEIHSYRELPIKIGEFATDFRYEASGAVKGLERVRCMCQNDAHLFVRPDQIKDQFKEVVSLILDVYKDFGLDNYKFRLSLRDPEDKHKYFDDDEMWNKAENELREVLNEIGVEYTEAIGEAAFYGPKLDVEVKPAVGPEITLSTCQLDFLLPRRFNLSYIDSNGEKKVPVVLHRAIFGTFDRFTAFILEETKGALPLWLSPVQINVIPVNNEYHLEYANKVVDELRSKGFRVELDARDEKMGYKIRESQTKKIPYTLVLGNNERDNNTITYRMFGKENSTTIERDEFIDMIIKQVEEYK